ncbi:MAG TPA: TetR/AcrR family transcriptional regulator [Acidimicrobiales bacterium]|nr:TetR/AcrR family transcriptional regulator [Acidimicrobiales bacterium]
MIERSRSDRRAARREQLLDGALAAVRRRGPGASMNELAAEAGVSKPILYRHFGDRDGLVVALGTRFARELMAELQRALAEPRVDARGTIEATVEAYVGFVERDRAVYRLVVRRAGRDRPGAVDPIGSFQRQVGEAIASVLGPGLERAGADAGGAEILSHGIVGLVHAAGDWWLDHPTIPRELAVSYVTDLLWGGLAGLGLASALDDGIPASLA